MKNFKSVLSLMVLTMGLISAVPAISRADMGDKGMGDIGMANEKAELAINGYCPVCVIHGMANKGNDNFVTVYKGKLYKFAGFDQQKMFIDNPETYTKDLEAKFSQMQK